MTISNLDPESFNHQFATIDGHRYHYVDEGNKDGKAILLVHGFPDLWYGWRHQIRYLASLGQYRVLAIDTLGYGGTDKPMSKEPKEFHLAYASKNLAGHFMQLLDQLKIEKAVLIGHDWGANLVCRAGWFFPERLYATISVGNPFRAITKDFFTLEDIVAENPAFYYFPYLGTPQAITDLDGEVEAFVGRLYADLSGVSEDWSKVRAYYTKNFVRGSLQAPLGYYKSFYQNYLDSLPLVGKRYAVPYYILNIEHDPYIHPAYYQKITYEYMDTVEEDILTQGDHFAHAQYPDEVNGKLRAYMGRLFGLEKEFEDVHGHNR